MDRPQSNEASASKSIETKTKRRKTGAEMKPPPSPWRNLAEQHIYSSNLLHALRQIGRSSPSSAGTAIAPRGRAVREAADRVLASADRGRSRWSRAILLSSRRNLKIKSARRRIRKPDAAEKRRMCGAVTGKVPAVERKAKVLGRLVPGCRKLSFPTLLEETSDYIAALQMQVRAMSALTEILSAVSVGDGESPATGMPGSDVLL